MWAFGDAQCRGRGTYKFFVQKNFRAVGVGGDFGDAETVRLCGVEAALISEEPRGNFDGGALAALSFCVGAGG
jgi:hypothetical protein